MANVVRIPLDIRWEKQWSSCPGGLNVLGPARREEMQFEVHGDGWGTLWTDELRVGLVVMLFLVVLLNLCFPMGEKNEAKSKSN
jgi:hypothetical protein